MAKKVFIGIKRLWYTEPLKVEPTQDGLEGILAAATEVQNVHQGTWGYTQDDPSVTEYINQLTGKTYYRDKESDGAKTISFTIGEYDYEDKAALQGGSVIMAGETVVGWKSSGNLENVEKAIIAQTKSGRYIVFTNAIIVAKVDTQDLVLGLGITAVAIENPESTISAPIEAEYWFEEK